MTAAPFHCCHGVEYDQRPYATRSIEKDERKKKAVEAKVEREDRRM